MFLLIYFFYLLGVFEVLLVTYVQQPLFLDLTGQGFEAKLGTSGGQRLNNPKEHTAGGGSVAQKVYLCGIDCDHSADLLM